MQPTYDEMRSEMVDEMKKLEGVPHEVRYARESNMKLDMILRVLCQIRDALYLEDDE